jgi:hypothetical protein
MNQDHLSAAWGIISKPASLLTDGDAGEDRRSLWRDVKKRGLDIRSSKCLAHFAENVESEDTKRLLSTIMPTERRVVRGYLLLAKPEPPPEDQRAASNKKARKGKLSKAVVPPTVATLVGMSSPSSDKARLVNKLIGETPYTSTNTLILLSILCI